MRSAHPNMYGQPTFVLPPTPGVQFYTTANSPLPQYGRNSQELQQLQQQHQPPQNLQQLQPMYVMQQPQMMHQYPGAGALVGIPTQVVGNPIPQPMAIQGVPSAGWAYRPAMPEPASVWGYGARGYNDQQLQQLQQQRQQSQQQETRNWQAAPSQGYPGLGFQGRGDGLGNGGVGSFQSRAGNLQTFVGRSSSGEGKRPERGFENSRHWSSDGGRSQHSNRHQPVAPLQSKQLSCEPCEKTFAVYAQYTAHMNTHVPCDDPGCSFSASGKVVKEHKLASHCKSSTPVPMRAALRNSESSDEIRAWREERRRNYPTRLNIQRKKDILEGRATRGELIEEDARQRRKRMKEILARQAELGCPVAEVPAYYLSNKDDRARGQRASDRSKQMPAPAANGSSASTINGFDMKKRKVGDDAPHTTTEDHPSKSARTSTYPSNNAVESEFENLEAAKVAPPEAAGSQPLEKAPRAQCYFYQRGRCRKGNRCHFAHTRGKKGRDEGEGAGTGAGRARGQKGAALGKKRPPTLLSKLLHSEVTRDKSYILQCLRFFVNNNFLVDGIVQPLASDSTPLESEESSDYSEGEVVEAPDVLLADTAIINTLLSENPEVLAKVIEMETQA